MKKLLLFSSLILLCFACGNKKTQSNETSKDSVENTKVGNDGDDHGCKPSTGYSWSELKNECVKTFEIGTKLNHSEDGKSYTSASYVIFEGDKAELFLDTQKESIILERKSEGEPWIYDDYELISWKGYVLKKGDKVIYTGE